MTKLFTAFDALTLSKDFIDRIDELIEVFNIVSNDKLFSSIIKKGARNGVFESKSSWFNKIRPNTIAEWVVSHFEARILH